MKLHRNLLICIRKLLGLKQMLFVKNVNLKLKKEKKLMAVVLSAVMVAAVVLSTIMPLTVVMLVITALCIRVICELACDKVGNGCVTIALNSGI